MVGPTEWDRYLRWNRAVADVVYAPSNAGQPVYLDLEDDVLESIRARAEPEASSATVGLVRAVRDVLRLNEGPSAVLRAFFQRLDRWQKGDVAEPPPTLALLSVMSLAAENMREGQGKAANNFYGRLAELLSLDEEQCDDFIAAYRKPYDGRPASDILWDSLTLWLERLEGNRGLPTVFAERNVHVSLPMSQALVREVDRTKFRAMFALYGLAPHSTIPVAEMVQIIDDWMSRVPCPASNQLERLWKRDADARERIAEVARLTLESWDGSGEPDAQGPKNGGAQLDRIRVRARLLSFPRKGVELSLVLPAPDDGTTRGTAAVLDSNGDVLGEVDLVPAASGWLCLAEPSAIDLPSFLAGETRLCLSEMSSPVRRRPRRVVTLRYDDLIQGYLECERASLGDDYMLVVHEDVAAQVDRVLKATARRGYQRHDELHGLPTGWVLYETVQILAAPDHELVKHLDLTPLRPVAPTQVALRGGFALPGNIKKWSSFRPPELRVSTDDASRVTATLVSVRALASPEPQPITKEAESQILIWDLGSEHLPDGDYEIAVAADGSPMGHPVRLRLRSADHPAVTIDHDTEPIVHDPDHPMFGIAPSCEASPTAFQIAPIGTGVLSEDGATTSIPRWFEMRGEGHVARDHGSQPAAIRIPSLESGTCMLTGTHHWDLETVYPDAPRKKLIEGVCKYCGLTKRYPTRGRKKRVERPSRRQGPVFDPSSQDPIRQGDTTVDWRLALDALSHVRSGPISSLERIAGQLEPTAPFADKFARKLEALGHIEIFRNPVDLRPSRWAVTPPTLVGLCDHRFALVGFRSESITVALDDAAYRAGLTLTERTTDDAPPEVSIDGSDPARFDAFINELHASLDLTIQVIPDAARALAALLQPLSKVLMALPTCGTPAARTIERWDPVSAAFVPAQSAYASGAYRLRTFGNVYLYVRPEEVGTMTATLGDARIVKFAAALDTGVSLIGYDADARVLYVPLGADLPGLYGRAAVLASGRPPTEDLKQRILRYHDVPPDLAARLQTLLMS